MRARETLSEQEEFRGAGALTDALAQSLEDRGERRCGLGRCAAGPYPRLRPLHHLVVSVSRS